MIEMTMDAYDTLGDGAPSPARSFTRTSPDGETWINAVLFSGSDAQDDDDELIYRSGLSRWYSGPGASFGREPMVRRSKTRALVVQHCGLDI